MSELFTYETNPNLIDIFKGRIFNSYFNAYYGFIKSGGFKEVDYNYCHAGLFHSQPCTGPFDAIVTAGGYSNVSPEITRKFYTWLLTESVFSDVFITKTVDEMLENGYFILDVTKPRNKIFFACILTRLPWDNYDDQELFHTVEIWDELVSNGVNKESALVLAYNLFLTDDGLVQIRNESPGHCPFELNNYIVVDKFLQKKGEFGKNRFNGNENDYPSTNAMFHQSDKYCNFCIDNKQSLEIFFKEIPINKTTKTIWGGIIKNFYSIIDVANAAKTRGW